MPLGIIPADVDPRTPSDYPDNPDKDGVAKMKHVDGPFFHCRVKVGPFSPNDIVSAKELGPHAEIGRLLKDNLISVASPQHADAYREQLKGMPPDPEPVEAKKESPVRPGDVSNSTQVVELDKPGTIQAGGFAQPPKAGGGK